MTATHIFKALHNLSLSLPHMHGFSSYDRARAICAGDLKGCDGSITKTAFTARILTPPSPFAFVQAETTTLPVEVPFELLVTAPFSMNKCLCD